MAIAISARGWAPFIHFRTAVELTPAVFATKGTSKM